MAGYPWTGHALRRLIVAPQARRDIDEILRASEADFGASAATRYRQLILQALEDLRADPTRGAARTDARLPEGLWLYHLRHANGRLSAGLRVGRPRHFAVYRHDAQTMELVRLLYDSMDLRRHIPR